MWSPDKPSRRLLGGDGGETKRSERHIFRGEHRFLLNRVLNYLDEIVPNEPRPVRRKPRLRGSRFELAHGLLPLNRYRFFGQIGECLLERRPCDRHLGLRRVCRGGSCRRFRRSGLAGIGAEQIAELSINLLTLGHGDRLQSMIRIAVKSVEPFHLQGVLSFVLFKIACNLARGKLLNFRKPFRAIGLIPSEDILNRFH